MLRDAQHTERWAGGPDHEVPLVAEGEVEVIREFAVDDGEEDGVFWRGFAVRVFTFAEYKTQGICCLVPRPPFFASSVSVASVSRRQDSSRGSVRLPVVKPLPRSLAKVRPRAEVFFGWERS